MDEMQKEVGKLKDRNHRILDVTPTKIRYGAVREWVILSQPKVQ